jgi:hypothetical protein
MKKSISTIRTRPHKVKRFVLKEDTELEGRVYPRHSIIWRNGVISFVQLGRDLKINGILYLEGSLLWLYANGNPRSGTIADDLELGPRKVLPAENDIYLDPAGNIWQVIVAYPVKYAGKHYPAGAKLQLDIEDMDVLAAELPAKVEQLAPRRLTFSFHTYT